MPDGADRLHALDLVWLEMQGEGPPIAIGTVAVMEGPAPTDDELLTMVSERLDRMPRLHQDLTDLGVGLRRPVWGESGNLDLPAHLHHVDAAVAGARPGLDAAVGHIMEQPLPFDQPLWDMWVIDGLEDRWALVWRVHHSIADGVGALILLGHGFDVEPEGVQTLADALLAGHSPPAADGGGTPRQGARSVPGSNPLAIAKDLGHDLGHSLGRALGALRGAVPHVIPAATALIPHPPGPLAGPVGPGRVWVSVDIRLAEVKFIGRALGATVNDVVLASVAGGFRDLLLQRGEPVEGRVVRNLIPMSLRPPGDDSAQNRLSGMLGHLPVGIADPVARLTAVQAGVGHAREAGTPVLASALLGLVDRTVPATVQDAAVGAVGRSAPAWFMDTLTTNVPGPQFPVYLCGRHVTAMYPLIPVAGHTCITTGIFSYDGTLNIGVTGDADQAGDVEILARGIGRAAAELAHRAGQADR
jgi:WS/DGAT/MGAT family acyltransferase